MATRANHAMSLNIVMGSALKGTDALYASFGGITKYAKSVEQIKMLKSTNFPLLNRNIMGVEKSLKRVESHIKTMNRRPLDFGVGTQTRELKTALREVKAIERGMKQTAFYSRKHLTNRTTLVKNTPVTHRPVKTKAGGVVNSGISKAKVGIGVGVGLGTASVIGAVSQISPIRNSINFETAMAEVAKATNADKKQIGFLSQSILKNVDRGSLLTPVQLAQIQASGGTSGVAPKDLPMFTEDVKKGAIALNLSTEKVGLQFAQLANRMGVPIKQLSVFTNSITALENSGTVLGRDILNTAGRLSGTFKDLKFKPHKAMAVSTLMNVTEVSPELAASSFNTFVTGLKKTNSKYHYYDKLKGNSENLKPIVVQITSDFSQQQIIKKFGSKFAEVVTGIRGNIKELDKDLAVVGTKQQRALFNKKYNPDKKLSTVGDFRSAVNNEYKIKLQTTEAKEIMAKNRITSSSIVMGDQMKTPYVKSLNSISTAMRDGTNFYKEHKEAMDKLGISATALLGTALAIKGTKFMTSPFTKVGTDLLTIDKNSKIAQKSLGSLRGTIGSLAGFVKRNPLVFGVTVATGAVMAGLEHMANNSEPLEDRLKHKNIPLSLRPYIPPKQTHKIVKSLKYEDTLAGRLGVKPPVDKKPILPIQPTITKKRVIPSIAPVNTPAIPKINVAPVESPSAVTKRYMETQKTQINNNQQTHITQHFNNSIKVNVTDGSRFDAEAFKRQMVKAQRDLKYDHTNTQLKDIAH